MIIDIASTGTNKAHAKSQHELRLQFLGAVFKTLFELLSSSPISVLGNLNIRFKI